MNTNIRPCYSWDLPRLVELGRHFFNEAKIGSTFDPGGLLDHLQALRVSGKLVSFLLVIDRQVVGAIVGCLSKQMMSTAVLVEELFWYVLPDYRGGTGGVRLMKALMEHAEWHADGIVMARLTAGHTDLHRYYGKLNFTEIESHYLKLWQSPPHSSSEQQ